VTVARSSITLSEWEALGPENSSDLAGRFLDASGGTRHVIERLTESNFLVGFRSRRIRMLAEFGLAI
jgi:hypothetical protein